jgi:membrane protease YdiL (CAAX protease family)
MIENLTEQRSLNPVLSILLFVVTLFLGFVVIGPIVGFLIALPFYPGDFMKLAEELTSGGTSEDIRLPLLVMQGCATGVGLIAVPALTYQFIVKMKFNALFKPGTWLVFGLTAAAVIAFMFPNSVVIEWNAGLNFSGPFWTWAREMEDRGVVLTKFLTTFESTGDFILGFMVIAVLPAIGEEFTFRGWLQPALQRATGNPHVAIWFAAFLFSTFHFQFFGFVPRLLLGGLFGYLMYWSNNLCVPIAAHFVNNGFSIIMMYLHQQKIIAFDAESTEALPLLYVAPFTLVFILIMIQLKKAIQPSEKTA